MLLYCVTRLLRVEVALASTTGADAIRPLNSAPEPAAVPVIAPIVEDAASFDVVTVSIDPRETPELARAKKAAYIEALGKSEAAAGWHFLTGEESQIRALAQAVGFGYKWIAEDKQFAHSAAIYVTTPDGRLSRYLYGIEYKPKDLKLALLEASNGKIGTVIDRLLLFCYRYNPQTHKYSVYFAQLMRAGGAGTVVVFGGYMAMFWRRQRRPNEEGENLTHGS